MSKSHFPDLIRDLPEFTGPFDAYRLQGNACDVLFAYYPAATEIEPHTHPTENVGIVTDGELILIVDGEEKRVGARSIPSRRCALESPRRENCNASVSRVSTGQAVTPNLCELGTAGIHAVCMH